MSALKLYYHPLSSYCWKAIIAFYENNTPFVPIMIEDEAGWAQLAALWPARKFPLLEDVERGVIIPEASVIIEYLAIHHPGEFLSIPDNGDAALEVRLMDRIFDNYVMTPMQNIIADGIRPEEANKDPFGVAQQRDRLSSSYGVLEKRLAGRSWAAGDSFSLADCAALPALYYANRLAPFDVDHPILAAYLNRLKTRPTVVRVLAEAEPYLHMFPG